MELRWLSSDCGRVKTLQYRHELEYPLGQYWNDVPTKLKCPCESAEPGKAISVIFKDNKTLCSECHRDIIAGVGCKTPEKTLEEKFREKFNNSSLTCCYGTAFDNPLARELADIAHKHFNP